MSSSIGPYLMAVQIFGFIITMEFTQLELYIKLP